jgi:indole-3-glycerol phosphate synthase
MTILAQICKDKMDHVQRMEHLIPDIVLRERIKIQDFPRGFIQELQKKKDKSEPALICEIKKASPSKGIIRNDFDPVRIAQDYISAGASCISVLTDQPYFKGHDEDLEVVHSVVSVPLLRKDFMLTPYQIYESRAMGADCVLIIMAALDQETATYLSKLAHDLGMDVLFEVHDHNELDRALVLSPRMIGVNARNLKTLAVDLDVARRLVASIPADIIRVAESGISSTDDIQSLQSVGFDAFLIGEAFMQSTDIQASVKNLLGK